MLPVDDSTGLPRGYFIVSRMQEEKTLPLCRITAKHGDIENLKQIFITIAKELKQNMHSSEGYIAGTILNAIPTTDKHHFYTSFAEGSEMLGDLKSKADFKVDLQKDLDKLLLQTSKHPLYSIVTRILPSNGYQANIAATLYLLSIPRLLIQDFTESATKIVLEWQNPPHLVDKDVLNQEISRMRKSWATAVNSHCHDQTCCKSKQSVQ
jgi:hypothetical protein